MDYHQSSIAAITILELKITISHGPYSFRFRFTAYRKIKGILHYVTYVSSNLPASLIGISKMDLHYFLFSHYFTLVYTSKSERTRPYDKRIIHFVIYIKGQSQCQYSLKKMSKIYSNPPKWFTSNASIQHVFLFVFDSAYFDVIIVFSLFLFLSLSLCTIPFKWMCLIDLRKKNPLRMHKMQKNMIFNPQEINCSFSERQREFFYAWVSCLKCFGA